MKRAQLGQRVHGAVWSLLQPLSPHPENGASVSLVACLLGGSAFPCVQGCAGSKGWNILVTGAETGKDRLLLKMTMMVVAWQPQALTRYYAES